MREFIRDHWKMVLIGLFGVAVGVFWNYMMRRHENKGLLDSLTVALTQLQSKPNPTDDEKNQMEYLQGEIYILNFKCK